MAEPVVPGEHAGPLDLSGLISLSDWALPQRVIDLARQRGLSLALAGGLAYSAYTGHWRDTKDTDLLVLPRDREAMIEVVTEAGLVDYFDQQEYDRSWIYRGIRDGVIVDVIWDMANHRAPVDEAWLTRGSEIDIHGTRINLVAPEELIWAKLYIVQRDRCDWPDLMNIIDAQGQRLDWGHLLRRAGEDVLLLGAMMSLFGWLCPARARELPSWIWSRMGIAAAEAGPSCHDDPRRVALLDTREWFGRTSGGA